MNSISYTSIFEKYYKKYFKKYRSLKQEIHNLEQKLIENPQIGIDLGNGLFKIKLAIKSKNSGKSGGFRVITYLIKQNTEGYDITLLILYDKSDVSEIPKSELLKIIKEELT
jgi:hypothetical protein